ncbi:MAG: glycosyltransferase family 2 protein [Planctomycetota bacterium]|nr:glycosyltransferase family 2 protein [Planctomycetota bacterium]
MRTLVAIPVFNEQMYVNRVLSRVLQAVPENTTVLAIDDGSKDATPCLLGSHPVEVIRHATNRGYGRSLQDAFRWAAVDDYDWVITMDCDEQHEPAAIPRFIEAAAADTLDVISGSRYLADLECNDDPPVERRQVNLQITTELNERLGLTLTDAFCGFKAYRVESLRNLRFDEDGYAFPMQFWVQAAANGLRIGELPVRLIYNDPNRSFGGPLDDVENRLTHYRCVMHREIERCADRLPDAALEGLMAGCRD